MRRYRQRGACSVPLMLVLVCLPGPVLSQVAIPDTTPLSFSEVPAGASLDLLSETIHRAGGSRLRCVRSRQDRSVQECRGSLKVPGGAAPVDIWLSAVDSLAGIITFKQTGSSAALDRWRNDLEQRYGTVATQVQGPQRMKQWVRRGRMIRLTWRREAGGTTVSVSLVDGRVLDGWGQRRVKGEE